MRNIKNNILIICVLLVCSIGVLAAQEQVPLSTTQKAANSQDKKIRFFLGISFEAAFILNESIRATKVNSTSEDITKVRSAELRNGFFNGTLGTINAKAGAEFFGDLDTYLNISWGGVNTENFTDFKTKNADESSEINDKITYSYSYFGADFNIRNAFFLRKKSISALYMGLGFGMMYLYDIKTVYKEGSPEQTYSDAANLNIIKNPIIWRVIGEIGIILRYRHTKLYMGFQPKYYLNSLYGDNLVFYVQEEGDDSNQIVKMTLPNLPATASVVIGLDYFF